MKKLLVVVDMQNDFVTGSLGTKEAVHIVDRVQKKVEQELACGTEIVFTRDTHAADYLKTQEGRNLPVEHCIEGTRGWEIVEELKPFAHTVLDKPAFGSTKLVDYIGERQYEEIELIGLCTDICVVSNALLLKAFFPETRILTDASCCAGVTPESHEAALATMRMCQVEVHS